jgi:hypothetical protein
MKNALVLVAVASCIAASRGQAASPPPVPDALVACSKLQDVNERVRCYDAQVAKMSRPAPAAAPAATTAPTQAAAPAVTQSSTPAATQAPAPVVRSAPSSNSSAGTNEVPAPRARVATDQTSPQNFGEELLPQHLRSQQALKEPALDSSITAVQKVGFDSYVFSLANGQVWRQDGNHITFFRVGYPVRIQRHNLGSYHMSSPAIGSKNWVYVTRIQ